MFIALLNERVHKSLEGLNSDPDPRVENVISWAWRVKHERHPTQAYVHEPFPVTLSL
jgi:hypothetical protein